MPNALPLQAQRTLRWGVLATSCALFLGACLMSASNAEVAISRSAVERIGDRMAMAAPVEMASARDKILRASEALALNDLTTARRLAREAEADAALAETRARQTRTEVGLVDMRDALAQLQARLAQA